MIICLTCGAKKEKNIVCIEVVKLQRGHKDPEKSLSISNIFLNVSFVIVAIRMILPLMIKAGLERFSTSPVSKRWRSNRSNPAFIIKGKIILIATITKLTLRNYIAYTQRFFRIFVSSL